MAPDPFPTTVADLFHDSTTSCSLYQSIRDIRKSTLSIQNRLRSIVADFEYVQTISETYNLPLIANERCGSWYIHPAIKSGSAYFKSTDGHHGQWSFSLRRLNLQILSIVGHHGGAIIVDSTRRGKNMPDALLKTVPIWVAVMNRALFPERTDLHALQCPPAPNGLSLSEISQIEARLDGWVTSFNGLALNVQKLRSCIDKPITIQWAVNGYGVSDQSGRGSRNQPAKVQDSHRLILCSASRRVVGAEVSEAGYIQGAGDDSEGWARGLTPELFWQHKEQLLNESTEEELSESVAGLLAGSVILSKGIAPRLINPTSTLYIGSTSAGSMENFDTIIDCNTEAENTNKRFLALGCRGGKLGSRDLRDKLHAVKDFVRDSLMKATSRRVLVTCSTGKDLSAGAALSLLCLFYNDIGQQDMEPRAENICKVFIKKRLAWISSSMPDVNPSRATLQSVNAFLMDRP